jgi:hypothetical protein
MLVLELCFFFSMSIFPRASEILSLSMSSNPLSIEENASSQDLFTSLYNLFLSARFVSQAFKIMSPRVFLERDN